MTYLKIFFVKCFKFLALLDAVESDNVAVVHTILQYDGEGRKNFNVNAFPQDSLLHKASRNGNKNICKMLIKFGADVNLVNIDNQNPLNIAEANDQFSVCELLSKKRKEKGIIYKKALDIHAKANNFLMCNIHLNNVNVNERYKMERTPLNIAVIFGIDEICDLLLKHGANVYAKDSNMDDPIQLAFYYGRFELRERFLSNVLYIG